MSYNKMVPLCLLEMLLVVGCGAKDGRLSRQQAVAQPPAAPSFAKDIQPILQAKCTPCHSSPELVLLPQFVNSEKTFRDNQSEVLNRITTTDPIVKMPPVYSAKGALSDEQRSLILKYFAG